MTELYTQCSVMFVCPSVLLHHTNINFCSF